MMAGTLPESEQSLTLSELIETGFLKCALCKNIYQDPRLLPCLHTFCRECIEEIQKIEIQSMQEIETSETETETLSSKTDQSKQQNGVKNEIHHSDKIKQESSSQSEASSNDNETIGNQSSPRRSLSDSDKNEPLTNGNAKSRPSSAKSETLTPKTIRMINLTCLVCKSSIQQLSKGRCAFPSNTFLKDLCEMYDYKHEKERTCDYCSFDGKQNTATSLCLDCHDNMCQSCTAAHRRTKLTREHKVITYTQVQKGLYDTDIRAFQHQTCTTHADEPMSLFCDKCEILICRQCKVHDHDDHKWASAEKAVVKYQSIMKNLLGGIQIQIPSVVNYIQFLANYDNSVVGSRDKQIAKIEEQSRLLHSLIDEQKAAYIKEINEHCDKERCELQVKTSNLKVAAGSLQNNEQFLRTLLQHGKADEILSLHKVITQRLTILRNMRMDGVSTKLRMDFIAGNSTAKNAKIIFGKLAIDNVPLKQGSEGLASTNALQITSILPNVNNTAELLREFDAEGKKDGKEVWPTGVAVSKEAEIIIVDRDNKMVKIYSSQGKLRCEITGEGEGKLGSPFDVAVLKSGFIAVTDHEAEDVKIFTTNGTFKFAIKEDIKYPRGITVNSKGEIIILDCQHLQVTVHDPNTGERLRTIDGKDTNGRKVLVDPYYITVSEQDNLIITDTASPNIKVFSPTGSYLAKYGHYGMRDDQILQPYGVCCDTYGYIFVADNINHRVHLLLPDGKFLKFLVSKSDGLWHPMGLCISEKGYLVVTEALGKVKVFKYI